MNPPIMKNTIDASENAPAPQRLGTKLPTNPPTNPPVYVGPLRTNRSFGHFDRRDHVLRGLLDGRARGGGRVISG